MTHFTSTSLPPFEAKSMILAVLATKKDEDNSKKAKAKLIGKKVQTHRNDRPNSEKGQPKPRERWQVSLKFSREFESLLSLNSHFSLCKVGLYSL